MAILNLTAVTRIRKPEEEKRIVSELTTSSFNEGESSYFLISKRWYTSWERYVRGGGGGAEPRPGPINNDEIMETGRVLVEDEDYLLVPNRVWNTLLEWYEGGPPIARNLINLFLSDARDDNVTGIRLPKQASIRELYDKVCAKKGVSQEKALIWDYFNMSKGKLLHPLSNKTLEELGLHMTQDILLEVDGGSSSELDLVPLEPSVSNGHTTTSLGKGLAGLVNLGNTCYMNSTLQCLAHTPPLVQYFLRDYTDHNPLGISGELAKAFGELLKELWSSSSGSNPVAPRFFKTKLDRAAPLFSGYNQHDSHELLISLLARLREVSDIVNVCQGQCKSTLVCPVCGKTATTYDSFMCLSLTLPPSTLNRSISLLSCLEKYFAEEPLGLDNMWDCPECKEKRQAKKKLDLLKLPDILVLHLARLKSSKYFLKKIDMFVDFPLNDLDLSKYVNDKNDQSPYLYELYAVSNHLGGVAVGHYTASVKLIDDDNNKWYQFNDSLVSPLNESEIKTSAAYVLFYRRRVGSETETQSAEVSRRTDDID